MKIGIRGASDFVNRMFEAAGPHQWVREVLRNSTEAGAKRIEFGLEWQAVERLGHYRRTISDDGTGMSPQELLEFFSTLGAGSKAIGGIHENFGVGAKISLLPWNPSGVIVISYKNGVGSMIWIVLDEETAEYELVEFDSPAGIKVVVAPSIVDNIDWSRVTPDWAREHGTTVVLLGDADHPHTAAGHPRAGGTDIKAVSRYLNTRFWDLSPTQVKVTELRSDKPEKWPRSRVDTSDDRRVNTRTVSGARHHVGPEAETQHGVVAVDEGRVRVHWWLYQGPRKSVHTYAQETGYTALRYNGELYHLTSGKPQFRWFGIVEADIQKSLTLVVEPPHWAGSGHGWGVYPEQSRNRLLFAGDGTRGDEPPMARWGAEFAAAMPRAIKDALVAARAGGETGEVDAAYRQRLQDRFGSRWARPAGAGRGRGARAGASDIELRLAPPPEREERDTPEPEEPEEPVKPVKHRKPIGHPEAPRGPAAGKRSAAVDVPRYRFAVGADFEQPWHLASWLPNDAEGPTVLINTESPILQEVVEYQQGLYADAYAETVSETVRQAFGEIVACRIAHTQTLMSKVPAEVLDADYRNERALTVSLMGLLAEESVITQRLAHRLRRKEPAAEKPVGAHHHAAMKHDITMDREVSGTA